MTGGDDGIARVWDAATRASESRARTPAMAPCSSLVMRPTASSIALGFDDGTVASPTLRSAPRSDRCASRSAAVGSVAFSGDGERLAAALDDGDRARVRRRTERAGAAPDRHEERVLGVDVSADGTRVVSAGEDGTVRLWDAGRRPSQSSIAAAPQMRTSRFSPDGTRILAVGDDRTVRLWDARTGARGAAHRAAAARS